MNALISQWGTALEVVQGRNLLFSGYTRTVMPVKYLNARVYLQKWTGYTWIDVTSWLYTKSNSDFVEGYGPYTANGSGYYRARAVHYADDGVRTEQVESTSPSINVN